MYRAAMLILAPRVFEVNFKTCLAGKVRKIR